MHSTSRTGRTSRIAVIAASGIAVAALVAGCGSSGGGSSTPSGSGGGSASTAPTAPGSPSAPSNPSNPSSPGAAAGAATLQTATDPKLGTIVTDGAGFTLYRFDKDTAKPPMSNCNGNCASLWPPVPADGSVTVKGIDSKLVGTVTRADGSKQVTLNGWPAYRYAPDKKPGDTTGQGVNGTWFALTPTGGKAPASAPSGGTAPSSPGSGYGGY
ncbi:hypothetical protein ACFVHB_29090 [Kitasatospora sp. NPDC127111]|uniref:hypothetical protein n=1 Tax=Kitasatospora sp. NPDC127111 TaxID=3345363 RepID=UPI00363F7E1C